MKYPEDNTRSIEVESQMSVDKKREIIICGLGTRGDIHPLVGLARLLIERGHLVTFLSNDKFRPIIERNGVPFHSIGTEKEYCDFYNDERAWDINSNPVELAFDQYYGPTFVPAFQFVRQKFEMNTHLLVIGLSLLNGARAAAKQLAIPYVLISLSPNLIPSRIRPPMPTGGILPEWMPQYVKRQCYSLMMVMTDRHLVRRGYISRLNQMRKQLGLDPVKRFVRHDYDQEDLHIGFFPEWFGMRPDDWPKKFKLVGFPLSDDKTQSGPESVDQFIEEHGAPVLFTSGTGVANKDEYFRESIDACSLLSVPCLLVGGSKPSNQMNVTPKVLHVDYVDFETVLPRCRAIAHHGGMGTLSQAIKAGIPQIIRPLMYDQPDNAYRIAKLGLGLPIWKNEYRSDRVVEALRMLTSKTVKGRIKAFSERVNKSKPLEKAYELITRL